MVSRKQPRALAVAVLSAFGLCLCMVAQNAFVQPPAESARAPTPLIALSGVSAGVFLHPLSSLAKDEFDLVTGDGKEMEPVLGEDSTAMFVGISIVFTAVLILIPGVFAMMSSNASQQPKELLADEDFR